MKIRLPYIYLTMYPSFLSCTSSNNICVTVAFSFLFLFICLLIQSADPQSRPVVIIYFRTYCPNRTSLPTFQTFTKQNNFQVRIVFATVETVGRANWIIDDTHMSCFLLLLLSILYFAFISYINQIEGNLSDR